MRKLWLGITTGFTLCALAGLGVAGTESTTTSMAVRTTRDLTLDEAVAIAMRQNPDILRAKQEIERTRGLVIEVRAQALPQLTVTSNYTQQDRRLLKDFGGAGAVQQTGGNQTSGSATGAAGTSADTAGTTPTTGGTTTGGTGTGGTGTGTGGTGGTGTGTGGTTPNSAENNAAETGAGASAQSNTFSGSTGGAQDKSWSIIIQARQLIYSGGQVAAAMKIARFTEDSSYWMLRDTVETVISNVRKQFYLVLLDRALITVQEESIRLLESQLADQENRFQAGTVPRFNVLQAEVALSNARPTLIRARNDYNIAELTLAKTLGINYDTAPAAGVPPINPIGELTTTETALPLPEALDLARANRPFLKTQRERILINVENINVALAGYQPRLEANAAYEFRNSRAIGRDLSDVVNGWFFGVTGTWNVFDGLATYGRTKQAKAQLDEARITYLDSVQQVELEVQQALATVNEAMQTIASQAKAVQEAQEAVRLARERLSAGAGTQLDVLNAQVALTQARTTAFQARYDYNVAMAEFDRVTARDTHYKDTFNDPLTRRQRARLIRDDAQAEKAVPVSQTQTQPQTERPAASRTRRGR